MVKNKEAIRNITTVLREGLAASFKDEKARLYEVFGTGWVASADLWETDMLCVLWAFGGSKVDGGPPLDCSLIGDEVKSELDGREESFRYVAFLLLTELVVTHVQSQEW